MEFYRTLSVEMNNANDSGKFDESNATSDWKNLLNKIMVATNEELSSTDNLNDYYSKVGAFWG